MKENAKAAVLSFLFVILSPVPAGGFVLQMYGGCRSEAGPQNMTFSYKLVFNKQIIVNYSPDTQRFLPCSEDCIDAIHNASEFITNLLNNNTMFSQRMAQAPQVCSINAQRFWGDMVQRTSPPIVRIAHIDPINTRDSVMLACYVYDFYPKLINITWLKNGDPITSNVTDSNTVLPNGDWSYQTQVNLELMPRSGDVYSCWVQHSSLGEPLVKNWNPSLTQLQQIKISMAVVVLALGLIFLLAGLIRWKKSRSDDKTGHWVLFWNSEAADVPIPGESYPEAS